jgi:hypothetical protein
VLGIARFAFSFLLATEELSVERYELFPVFLLFQFCACVVASLRSGGDMFTSYKFQDLGRQVCLNNCIRMTSYVIANYEKSCR